jgi:hypothetical protein
MHRDLEHYKQLAIEANTAGDVQTVNMIIALRLAPLFRDHREAYEFYAKLQRNAPPSLLYSPMND